MKKLIALLVLFFIITTLGTSCSGIAQQEYDELTSQLYSMNIQYAQMTQQNISLKSKIEELESQLTESEQARLSLQTEIENYESHPLATDVVIHTGAVIKGRTMAVSINYFERIEGKVIGDGFHAYLKQSGGDVVLDLGIDYERQFSFIPPDPSLDYYIDYEVLDEPSTPPQYITAYVLFY
jgi:cell division protein FtsB